MEVNNNYNDTIIEIIEEEPPQDLLEENYEDLPNYTVGMMLLGNVLKKESHDDDLSPDFAELILKENEQIEKRLEALKKSEKRMNVVKWVCVGCSFFLNVTQNSVIEGVDQFRDPDSEGQRTGGSLFVFLGTLAVYGLLSVAGIALWREEKKHKELKKETELNQEDINTAKLFHTLLENWGALYKAKQEDSDNQDNIAERAEKKCFDSIKVLPVDILNNKLPSKETLTSITIDLLPENNHIKETVQKIKFLQEDCFPKNLAFIDRGQQTSQFKLSHVNNEDFDEDKIKELYGHWNYLRAGTGLSLNRLHFQGSQLVRPTIE